MFRLKWTVAWRLALTLLMVTPFMTGCWDRLEIEQRAAVLGLAIDCVQTATNYDSDNSGREMFGTNAKNAETSQEEKVSSDVSASEGESFPRETPLHLTAQIAVPGRIPLGPGESGGGGGTSPSEAVWVVHSEGKTLNDALARMQQQVADRIFLGHLRVLIVSEDFARQQGLEGITDVLRRNPEIRRTAWITISKGRAYEMMRTAPPLERVPTLYFISTMDHAKQMGKLPNDFLGMFESKAMMKGRDPVLPYIEVSQRDNINVAGLAFFKDYKMVDTTKKPISIATYMELDGNPTGGYTMMVPVPGQDGSIMVQANRRKRKIRVDIRNGIPHFTVRAHVDGSIIGKMGENFRLDDPRVIRGVELEIDKRLEENMRDFIAQTQKVDADISGFGEYVRARKPRYWDRNIGTKEKWDEMYPRTSMDFTVTFKIHRVGMKGV